MDNQAEAVTLAATPITLLRVEAVNLAYSIEDTEQLSTRRGGGLLLLEAVRSIASEYKHCLEPISTGASAGLFRVKIEEVGCCAADCAKKVGDYLAKDPLYKHATFMVVTADGKFEVAKEKLLASIHWDQMQSLSFATPGLNAATGDYPVCTFDEVRPAHTQVEVKRGDPERVIFPDVSNSVQMRHDYGRIKKQARKNRRDIKGYEKYEHIKGFYEEELGSEFPFIIPWKGMSTYLKCLYEPDLEGKLPCPPELVYLIYTQHFEDLAKPLPPGIEPKELNGKMAVFYADGNKFGRIDRGCKSHEKLKEWDDYIKDQRRKLLAEIVARAYQYDHWKTSQAGKVRLEILLWGGDELIFVVPGWCGMEFAQLFFEATQYMEYVLPPDEDNKPDDKPMPLTHACGMVFCHHQAPISGITRLAKKLAEKVKRSAKQTQVNALNWMVLESFDHAQADLDDLKKARYPHHTPDWDAIALTSEAVDELQDKLPALKNELPRSVIVRIVRMMACGAAFTKAEKSSTALASSNKTAGSVNPQDEVDEPSKLLASNYLSLDETISKMDEGGKDFKELWKALQHKPNRGNPDSLSHDDLVKAEQEDASKAEWKPGSPKPEDLAAWVKLLELWDYCPGLYQSAGAKPASGATNQPAALPEQGAPATYTGETK